MITSRLVCLSPYKFLVLAALLFVCCETISFSLSLFARALAVNFDEWYKKDVVTLSLTLSLSLSLSGRSACS